MKSGSKTRVTIKWVLLITVLFQILSYSSNAGFSLFGKAGKLNDAVAAAVAAATPELPRVLLNTAYTPPSGPTITVNAGGNLQTAINQAQPGTTILLQAGATFTGNFTLPAKNGTAWIVIRTATPDANLPAQGTRIAPQNASLLPKIITPNSEPAIRTEPGAHNYRLLGLEIGIQSGVPLNYGIVSLGDGSSAQNSLSQVPQDIVVDRCYVHGNSTGDVSRGIALNSGRTAVIDSFVSECHAIGGDTQAICGWNGPGPFKVVNNYLEGAAENFMLGGADPAISGLIPSDIEFRNNYLYKPLRWKVGEAGYAGIHWSVKNLFELKNAQRILVDGNTFENNWSDAQDGFAIVLKSVNQDGAAPWSLTCDVTFTNNIVKHSGAGVNLLGRDLSQLATQMRRILIRNNVFDDINGTRWGATHGRLFQISDSPDVIVDHNTANQSGDIITAYGAASLNFVFTNNITAHGLYGVKGDGRGTGTDTINTYLTGAMFSKNVLAGGNATSYPTGNFFPVSLSNVGFVNMTGGDYRLSSTSPYRNAGTDGLDIGWLSNGQASPTPTPTATPTPTPALTITNVVVSSITTTSATITWTTNQFTDSQVEYGTTTGYGQQTSLNPTLLTSHVEIISGLTTDTAYNFRVKSRTSGGTLAISPNVSFWTVAMKTPTPTPTPIPTPTPTPTPPVPTNDIVPPVISGVSAASITTSAATINWLTNEASDSQIEYGETIAYGLTTGLNASRVTNHSMALSGLRSGALYNYRVKSRDAAGNLSVSGNFTFVTGRPLMGTPVGWAKLRGVTVVGTVLKKVAGCEGCRSSAVSQQAITSGDGYVEFVAAEFGLRRWVGLMSSWKTVTTDNIDFNIMLGGEAAIFERGVFKMDLVYKPGDVFRIALSGGIVRYYKNGLLIYTSSQKPSYPLVTAAWIDQIGGTVTNAVMGFGSYTTTAALKK